MVIGFCTHSGCGFVDNLKTAEFAYEMDANYPYYIGSNIRAWI